MQTILISTPINEIYILINRKKKYDILDKGMRQIVNFTYLLLPRHQQKYNKKIMYLVTRLGGGHYKRGIPAQSIFPKRKNIFRPLKLLDENFDTPYRPSQKNLDQSLKIISDPLNFTLKFWHPLALFFCEKSSDPLKNTPGEYIPLKMTAP